MAQKLRIEVARAFVPLLEPARYKGVWGGRGSGKSHAFAELLVEKAMMKAGLHAVCVREIQKDLKHSAKKLIEDKIRKFGVQQHFNILDKEIKTPGGGVIIFQGMQDHTADSIKSLESFDVAWIEEGQTISSRSLELLRPSLRAPGSEIWASWNPRNASDPIDTFFRGPTPFPGSICLKANYDSNPWFTAELEEERSHDERSNPVRYAHIWLGEYEPAAVGALFDRLTLHRNRRHEPPTLKRIVVAVDPNISSEPGADETGVIVCGLGEDGRGYVLEDATVKGGPTDWARRAVVMFDKWDADGVVIETNQGGEMCRLTLRTVRPTLPVVEVHATRGKHVRAEPIAALYATDRVSHVGTFPELENELCLITASGFDGSGSPNRADALVWGMAHLFPAMTKKVETNKPKLPKPSGHWMG